MDWDDDKTDTLVALWRDKQSSAVIAKELGISRSAVMGKVRRLGLTGKGPAPRPPPGRAFRKIAAGLTEALQIAKGKAKPVSQTPPSEPNSFNCKLVDLKETSCRWPYGDPRERDAFYFCGQPRYGTKPYCLHHTRLAWAKTAPPSKKYYYTRA